MFNLSSDYSRIFYLIHTFNHKSTAISFIDTVYWLLQGEMVISVCKNEIALVDALLGLGRHMTDVMLLLLHLGYVSSFSF